MQAGTRSAPLTIDRAGLAARTVPSWLAPAGLLALGALFLVGTVDLAVRRHDAFATGRHDLEIYTQVAWSLANGSPFQSTLLRSNTMHLAEHLALAMLPLGPLYGLWPDPRLLLVLQQLALTAMVVGIGFWARSRLGDVGGLIFTACALLSPVLGGIALDDFHAVVLAATLGAPAMILAVAGRPRSAALFALAASLMEEEAGLMVAGLGLLLVLRGQRRLGGVLTVTGPAVVALAALAIMPGFHHPGTLEGDAGTRSAGHFSELRSRPAVLVERLTQRGPEAVAGYILPTAGAALLAPAVLAAGAPTFAALFLQDRGDTFARHWATPLLPVVGVATVVALAGLSRQRRTVGLAALVAGSVAAYALLSPLPGGRLHVPSEFRRTGRDRALERSVALLPRDAPVAVSAPLAAHLANRREVYIYPIDDQYLSALRYEERVIEAYVLDLQDEATQRVRALSKNSPLMANPPYVVRSTAQKLLVLTRSSAPPQQPLDQTFGRGLAFRGYELERSGDRLQATFHWERTAGISGDFRRIVQLVDRAGRVAAEDGDLELTLTLPTNKWQVGQQVRDTVDLPAPGPGRWTLRVQWQNRDQRRPILLPDGSSHVDIPL